MHLVERYYGQYKKNIALTNFHGCERSRVWFSKCPQQLYQIEACNIIRFEIDFLNLEPRSNSNGYLERKKKKRSYI